MFEHGIGLGKWNPGPQVDGVRHQRQRNRPLTARQFHHEHGGVEQHFIQHCRVLEKQLRRLRSSCNGAPGDAGCGILHELVAAAHGEACACHAEDIKAAARLKNQRRAVPVTLEQL